nr:unnamed protein product [Callosobruchus chinensis]
MLQKARRFPEKWQHCDSRYATAFALCHSKEDSFLRQSVQVSSRSVVQFVCYSTLIIGVFGPLVQFLVKRGVSSAEIMKQLTNVYKDDCLKKQLSTSGLSGSGIPGSRWRTTHVRELPPPLERHKTSIACACVCSETVG